MTINSISLYPWQSTVWQRLNNNRQQLPHAILLHGRAGIGKFHFAKMLSQSLLCKSPNSAGQACQACTSCHWFNEDAHPDLRILSPEEDAEPASDAEVSKKKSKKKNNISIAQVRDLSDFINLSSHHQHGLRIVLIHPAESLNIASANALLKMLEEPASNVVFILVAHQIHRLLPTILSRCHQMAMPTPDESMAIDWLNAQGVAQPRFSLAYFSNSPLQVTENIQSLDELEAIWRLLAQGQSIEPAVVSAKLLAGSVEFGLNAWQKWLYDLLCVVSGSQIRYHLAHTKALQQLASRVNLNALLDLIKKTQALKSLALHPLNHALQLECLLLDYTKIFSSK